MFFGACHLSTHMSPAELAERVREGLRMLEEESPRVDASRQRRSELKVICSEAASGQVKLIKQEVEVRRELDSLVTQMHSSGIRYEDAVREFKKQYLREVLVAHRGNQCKAAEELGMHRNTLSRTMAELGLSLAEVRAGLKRPPRSERPVFSAVPPGSTARADGLHLKNMQTTPPSQEARVAHRAGLCLGWAGRLSFRHRRHAVAQPDRIHIDSFVSSVSG